MNESLKKYTNTLIRVLDGKATLKEQDEALKCPMEAYYFAKNIPGANIEKYQKAACKDSFWAYMFAKYVEGVDIEKCQKAACQRAEVAYEFTCDIKGADIGMSLRACKGTRWEDKLNEYLMSKALM